MMNMKKVLFIGVLVLAMGIGAMIGPVLSFASTSPAPFQPPFAKANFQPPALDADSQAWHPRGWGMGRYFAGFMHDEVAELLRITADELYTLRTEGKSIEEIAKDKGVSTDKLIETLIKVKTEQLDQLVADKVITEEHKAYILSNMEENIKAAITRTDAGPGYGCGGGKGFNGPRFNDSIFQPGQGRGFGPRWSNNNNL